jgi:hypothetical protein
VLAVSFLAVSCGRPHGADVVNGGFEDGLDGWTADGGAAVVESGAHSGMRCAGGAADEKGWSLSQSDVGVAKGRTYRVDAWVRANGAASVALYTDESGKKDEQRTAVWAYLPDAWTPVSAYVTAKRDGKLTLRFAATSDAKAAVFLDDVSLHEASPPTATQVEPGKGFDDEPSMVRAADGTYYVAWISWRDGGDSLQVARFHVNERRAFECLGAWQIEGGAGTNILWVTMRPSVIETAGSSFVSIDYQSEHENQFGCMTTDVDASGPGSAPTIQRVLKGAMVFGRFDDARSDNCDIFTTSLRSTMVCYVRRTIAPTIDRDPVEIMRGLEGWILYENVETPGYRVSFETMRRVVVSKIHGDLLQPKNYAATSPLWDRAESASAAFDDKGRLWVAYLKPRLPTAGWEVWLTGWTGRAWVPPIPVSSMKGMNRRPSLAIDGNRAIVCFQADDLPTGWGEIDGAKDAKSGVYLTSIELPDAPAAPQELEPLVENPAKWEAAEIRHRFGDDAPVPHETTVGGETLHLLFGDLHSHSDTSVCERLLNGSADDVYAMQRDFLHLDFACLTDHGEDFNAYLWNRQAKLARANDVPGKFTTFLGEEWTSGYDGTKPEGFYGHRNIILGDLKFPRWWNPRNGQTPAQLWADLKSSGVDFVTIPHQLADTGNVPTDWSFTDEVAQPVAEVFQIRGSYEAPGAPRVARNVTKDASKFLQGALKSGVVVGVIASPDHGGGVGKACVWAKENSRKAILDALRARRCYGTSGARIALEMRANGRFMGEKTQDGATGDVTIDVHAICPNDVARISVCRGGEWIHEERPSGRDFAMKFTDANPPAGAKWYYVRVEQTDGELAWSSPVWLGASR